MHGASGSDRQRLDTRLLLRAYGAGLFPMADTREAEDIYWVEPRRRGVVPLDGFHLPRSLAKHLKKDRLRHSTDLAFEAVMRNCAASGPGREQSWINRTILDAYLRLHHEGHAHSIECWNSDGRLVGGLYGVRLGAAFFGESMFSLETDASKAALAHLVARLRVGGFRLLDTQFLTAHLARFGAREVRREQYMRWLSPAIIGRAAWDTIDRLLAASYPSGPFDVAGAGDVSELPFDGAGVEVRLAGAAAGADFGPSGKSIVQLLSQTS